jgi:glutamate synthase (NADPH/NADH) small chain
MSTPSPADPNPKYAWQQLPQRGLPKRSVAERAADFLEIYGKLDEKAAQEEASRCIQCPNPSCVSGCPLCNPIPQWMQLTAEGRFLEAAGVLGSVNNLAEVCARLCPSDHLCEHTCILDGVSEPVRIQALEQFLIDYAFEHGKVDTSTAKPNGLKVAIVGSGPGALACADDLARKGYAVTVLDSEMVPGGLLVNGTPAFRLDDSIVQRRIDLLRKKGVAFRLGVALWREVKLSQLQNEFDAVFLAFDSRQARLLEVPGANLKGVVPAPTFILQKKTGVPLTAPLVKLSGKRVAVIGAGDTALDCARAAVRYDAAEAICLYRRDEMEMTCSRHEYRNAIEEGVKFVFQVTPVEVLGNSAGEVTGLRMRRTAPGSIGPDTRRTFPAVPGSEFSLEAEVVIPALGFDAKPCPHDGEWAELKQSERGRLAVDDQQMTSIDGVFAAGDLVRGPSNLLQVVRDARRAGEKIHAWLFSARLSA